MADEADKQSGTEPQASGERPQPRPPGYFEGESMTRRRAFTIAAQGVGGVAGAAIVLPALGFAVAPLLREMALALGGGGDAGRSREAWTRCAVLVRSHASPAQVAREFKLVRRCI
ncbi:MAG TPA: hypothetical protein VF770_07985, partial [Solirubrobacterales bacterium]